MHNHNEEIISLLRFFQKGYTERNSENIESFMDKLFIANDNCYIIGTSITEWCFGYDEVKELFT